MAQDSKNHLSPVSALLVAILSLGLFSGGTALMVKAGVVSSAPFAFVLGDDDEDEEDDDSGKEDDEDKDDEDDDKDKEKLKKEEEKRKKEAEKERERLKEQSKLSTASGQGGNDDDMDEDGKEDDEDEDEMGDDGKDEDGDGDDDLKDLMEKIAESEKEIFEKQGEGTDATTALLRVASARTALDAYKAAIAAGNLEEAERLAREVKKLSHFAVEEDLHDAKKATERLKQAQEKIGKAQSKLALLAAAGGSTESLSTLLAGAQERVATGNALVSAGDFMGAENLFKEAKGIANRVKDAAESALYALGGSDDDFDDDHEEFAEELSDDLDDIAEIESDDNRVKAIKRIVSQQKASGLAVASAVQLAQGRSALAKFFLGADDGSLESITAKIAENTQNAQALRVLARSSGDADIQELLGEQAERIEAENAKLQAFVTAQSDSNGIFGWLADLFR